MGVCDYNIPILYVLPLLLVTVKKLHILAYIRLQNVVDKAHYAYPSMRRTVFVSMNPRLMFITFITVCIRLAMDEMMAEK